MSRTSCLSAGACEGVLQCSAPRKQTSTPLQLLQGEQDATAGVCV